MTGSFVAFAIQKGVREIKACESSRPRKHARISSCNCVELSSSANGAVNRPLRAIGRVRWFLGHFDAALQDTPLSAERRELEVDPTELRVGGKLAARMGKSSAFANQIRGAVRVSAPVSFSGNLSRIPAETFRWAASQRTSQHRPIVRSRDGCCSRATTRSTSIRFRPR